MMSTFTVAACPLSLHGVDEIKAIFILGSCKVFAVSTVVSGMISLAIPSADKTRPEQPGLRHDCTHWLFEKVV